MLHWRGLVWLAVVGVTVVGCDENDAGGASGGQQGGGSGPAGGGGDTGNARARASNTVRTQAVGSTSQCPNGGVSINHGIDDNGNGVLDSNEIDGTEVVCNGRDGTDGDAYEVCTWCNAGETTVRYDPATLRTSIFTCNVSDYSGCGDWSLSETCDVSETFRAVYATTDALGFPARGSGNLRYECVPTAGSTTPTDECQTALDCGDASFACRMGVTGGKVCVQPESWARGTGTWVYQSNSFSWPVASSSSYSTCKEGLNNFWYQTTSECSLYFTVTFNAPGGGLSAAVFSTMVNTATPLHTSVTPSTAYVNTSTNVSTHTGSPTYTVRQLTLSSLDARAGGIATGTWQIAGTIQGTNNVTASGDFKIVFQ